MAKPLMFLPPILFAGLAAMFYLGMQRDDPNALPSTMIGREAPAMNLVQLGDKPLLTDAGLREPGIKLVNFWGSWCVSCRVEHPMLMKMATEMGITFHGINYDDPPDRALAYLAEEGNPFTLVGQDATGRNKLDWGVYGAPETFIIDGEGKILYRHAGPITEQDLERVFLPAMRGEAVKPAVSGLGAATGG